MCENSFNKVLGAEVQVEGVEARVDTEGSKDIESRQLSSGV